MDRSGQLHHDSQKQSMRSDRACRAVFYREFQVLILQGFLSHRLIVYVID
jgi:hypothetical protein